MKAHDVLERAHHHLPHSRFVDDIGLDFLNRTEVRMVHGPPAVFLPTLPRTQSADGKAVP
jgi:hypothetical protein